MEIMENLKI